MNDFFQLVGTFLTAGGIFIAYRALKSNHDWNRRQYTLNMVRDWNEKAVPHAKEIEKVFPTLLDEDKKTDGTELTKQRAIEIYTCSNEGQDWELRYHMYELLNIFEFISTAYLQGVADEKITEDSFKQLLLRYHNRLSNFIVVVNERRGYQTWPPYTKLIEKWQSKEVEVRKKADD